jgi:dihydroorotate dehydrogenase
MIQKARSAMKEKILENLQRVTSCFGRAKAFVMNPDSKEKILENLQRAASYLEPAKPYAENPYLVARPFLFLIEAERAHRMALSLLRKGFGPRFRNDTDLFLRVKVCDLDFPNPIGLAAGFDKHADAIIDVFGFGFGSVELGSITPKPQPGNPSPRLFRAPAAEAIINRFGFNSDGFEACLRRITAYRDALTGIKPPGIVGINIGKNKDSADAVEDYVEGVAKFAPYADYLTVNVSSPNTPGLRDLQARDVLADLLGRVMAARNGAAKHPPVFVKIAPDQTEAQQEGIAQVALASGIDGLIVGNTTVSRPDAIPPELAREAGGLSGKPLFDLSTRVLANMYKLTGGKLPLIGCGGVSSGEDAYAKIRAGASLVQLYTALIYKGPLLVPRINRELGELLRRDGFKSVAEAVGAGQA